MNSSVNISHILTVEAQRRYNSSFRSGLLLGISVDLTMTIHARIRASETQKLSEIVSQKLSSIWLGMRAKQAA